MDRAVIGSRLRQWGGSALAVGGLVQMVRWGGTARGGPIFVFGVALLIGLLLVFGGVLWWLYGSRLSEPSAPVPLSSGRQQRFASGIMLGGLLFLMGGFWDEAWHRSFGGFGDDFLWPPHMLLYASILTLAAMAGVSLLPILGRPGSLRARFRAEPARGLLGIVTLYLLASLPSDELWHRIYGKDLTAWSLPHLWIALGLAAVMLVGAAVQLGLAPADTASDPAAWRSLRGAPRQTWLALVPLTWAASMVLQIGTTEWDNLREASGADAFAGAFWERPAWLYPVVVLAIGALTATLALHATRRVGAATAVALAVAGFRWLLVAGVAPALTDPTTMKITSHLLTILPALAIDAWYAARAARRGSSGLPPMWATGLAATAGFFAAAPLVINARMAFPRIDSALLPAALGYGLLAALAAAWGGRTLGDMLRRAGVRMQVAAAPDSRALWASLAGLGATAAAVLAVMLVVRHP